ncbi:hypothetical protein BDA96_05G119300 [Sorghum bicolor]|uniref:Uncharacterized protein n=1 Tax=Sorghum bicolor TaxID=4558 RepID=A0A921QZ36_SORBI|nr:hypothetical protein BDA96_05G119300 [Sorghum bicolor]
MRLSLPPLSPDVVAQPPPMARTSLPPSWCGRAWLVPPARLVLRQRQHPAMGLGFRKVATAASSRGACGTRRPELCMGAARNPRPARRARCRGTRPGLAGRSQGRASASTLARTEGARPRLTGRAARGARPPPRWPGRRARGWGSRPLHVDRLTPRPAAIALVLTSKNV